MSCCIFISRCSCFNLACQINIHQIFTFQSGITCFPVIFFFVRARSIFYFFLTHNKLDFDLNLLPYRTMMCVLKFFFFRRFTELHFQNIHTHTKHFVVPQVVDKKKKHVNICWPKNYPAEAMIDSFCGIFAEKAREKLKHRQPEGKLQRYEVRSTNQLEWNR